MTKLASAARARGAASACMLLCATLGCAPAGNSGAARDGVSADARVTLERLPCYGTCPVYVVDVAADGTIAFDGRQHVDSLGMRRGRIAPAAAAALLRDLETSGFFELQPRYVYPEKACGAWHTDAPRVNLTLVLNGRSATVEHDHGCDGAPRMLRRLQERVDSVAGVARWIDGGG